MTGRIYSTSLSIMHSEESGMGFQTLDTSHLSFSIIYRILWDVVHAVPVDAVLEKVDVGKVVDAALVDAIN